MTDEEKYSPNLVWVDRQRTAQAVREWNEEARSRARDDAYMRLTGRTFLGIEPDPNAAFVVGVLQKHFFNLVREKNVVVHMVPCIRENAPDAVGIVTLNEAALSPEGRESLEILVSSCDDVTRSREPGEEGGPRVRLRFTVHDVWKTYERRGNSYAEWLRLTYGDERR